MGTVLSGVFRSKGDVASRLRPLCLALAVAVGLGSGIGQWKAVPARAASPPPATTSSIGLFAPDWKAFTPRTTAQWQQDAQSFSVMVGMVDAYAPVLSLLHAANPNLTVLFYNVGPYIVSTDPEYPQLSALHPSWFAHDANGNRITVTQVPHVNSVMYLMEQSNNQWRAWEVAKIQQVLQQFAFDGVYVDLMGDGPINGGYTDATPVNPATNQPYTVTQWLEQSVLTLNAIKAGVGTKFVMFNGLVNGTNYWTDGTRILSTSNADGGLAEEFIREATAGITQYPSPAVWLQNLTMIVDMQSRDKAFFGWTKTWTKPATSAQVKAWNVFAEATYLLGKGGNAYYCFLPPAGRTKVFSKLEEANLGAALGPYYTLSTPAKPVQQVYERLFTSGAAWVNPAAQTAGIAVGSFVTSVSPSDGDAGTSVTIDGTGFSGATAVSFGSTAATAYSIVSNTQITATVPAGSGTVDVTVTGPAGTSQKTFQDQFTYQ